MQVIKYGLTNNPDHEATLADYAEALDHGDPGLLFDTKEEAFATAAEQNFDVRGLILVTFEVVAVTE